MIFLWYIAIFLAGFVFAVFLINWEDIKRSRKAKRGIKRYNRLFNGIHKKLVQLHSWDAVFEYRKYPFLLNDEIVGVKHNEWRWWHCNDINKRLYNTNGDFIGYLTTVTIRARKCYSGWFYYKSISLSQNINAMGSPVKIFAVVEVK